MRALSLWDRFGYALIGIVFGVFYGALLAVVAVAITGESWSVVYVQSTALVFGALAFVVGPFIGDAIAGMAYAVWGVFSSWLFAETLADSGVPARRPGFLAALFWFGAATAIAIFLAVRVW